MKSKGWSRARRAKMAENCRKNKPWQRATGPKTDTGKSISSQNAVTHGMKTKDMIALKSALNAQYRYLQTLMDDDEYAS